jgi:transposase
MDHWICVACNSTKRKKEMCLKPENHRGLCKTHYNQGIRMSDFEQQPQQQQQQVKQLEFLSHRDSDNQRMNSRQRDAIITLFQNGDSVNEICMKVGCVKSTVYRWLNKYDATHELNDDLREGRKRKIDELTVDEIIETSNQDHFKTPKSKQTHTHSHTYSFTHSYTHICVRVLLLLVIKHELDLSVSARTVRRRLDEHGLFGRLASSEHEYTTDQLNQRINFGEG